MGFGIALLGYAFLLMHELGGAAIAAPLLAYGFFLASRLNAKFMYAAVTALFMMPRGIVHLLDVFKVISLTDLPALNLVTFVIYVGAWLLTTVFWIGAVLDIANENNAQKLARSARIQLAVTVAFLLFTFAVQMISFLGAEFPFIGQALNVQYVLQYVLILYNLFFLHTCFVLITSEKQYRKDLQEIASERADELEKRHARSQEEGSRNEKHRR